MSSSLSRRALLAASAFSVAGVSAACGSNGDGGASAPLTGGDVAGTITLWGGANLVTASEIVTAGFVQEHPEVSMEYQKYPFAEYPTKMRLQLSSRADTPDLMIIHDYFVGSFIEAGWLEDLSSEVAEGDYVAGSIGAVSRDGKVYGIPGQSNPAGFWYRQDVFDQLGIPAPTTLEEYTAAADVLHGAGLSIDALDPNVATTNFLYYLYQSGGSLFDDDGTLQLGDPAVEALQALYDHHRAGYLFAAEPNSQDYWSAANSGKLVARLGLSADAAYLTNSLDPAGAGGFGAWTYANPPALSSSAPASYLGDGSFFVINAASQNKTAALSLAKYLTGDPAAAVAYDDIDQDGVVVRQTPSQLESLRDLQQSATEWEVFGGQKVNATKAELLLTHEVGHVYRDDRSTKAEDAIELILPDVFSGKTTPAAAVQMMTENIGAL